jgi:divalent metal cation (Fe/Co/Zn/Cd) transporter
LDATADQTIIDYASTLITQNLEIATIDSLMICRSRSIYIGELSFQIKENNTKKAHQIIDAIEDQLKKEINGLEIRHHPLRASCLPPPSFALFYSPMITQFVPNNAHSL